MASVRRKKPTEQATPTDLAMRAVKSERQPRPIAKFEESDSAAAAIRLLRSLLVCAEEPQIMRLILKAPKLTRAQSGLTLRFVEQVVEIDDPDSIGTFLSWRDDPVLDTILLLCAKLAKDDRYEVLEFAEDLLGRERKERP